MSEAIRRHELIVAVTVLTFALLLPGAADAQRDRTTGDRATTAERGTTDAPGGVVPGQWVLGFRPGFSVQTQEAFVGTDSHVGFALNMQALYALNNWLLAGLTFEWERRGFDAEPQDFRLGTLNTVSLIPTIEVRPMKYGPLVPYASAGIGVNVNSFSESDQVRPARISPSNTFAFRLAGGADYFLTRRIALNTEIAWKRNRGGVEVAGGPSEPFDASSFNFLFGVRFVIP